MFQFLLCIIYLSFISLGLPDSMLGAAWPEMYKQFGVPISYAGILSAIIAAGTIISSLQSDRLTLRFGAGKVTAFSVAMTAVALYGFSCTHNFWLLCFWAIPYGLGGGSVDASLNNYVALHYQSRHMSWLHCMWGVGAATGPYIMGYALARGAGWNAGYYTISMIQVVLTIILFVSLPKWKRRNVEESTDKSKEIKPMSLVQIVRIGGVKEVLICFFCYCAIEQTAGLWASSYFNVYKCVAVEIAARYGAIFFVGITVGRALSGFLTMKLSDVEMIRLGEFLILLGIFLMMLPLHSFVSLIGLILIGLGCAPIYPCIIHSTPFYFGADKSQAIIGVQMASAYVGTLAMPPLFGLIANVTSLSILPIYLLLISGLMVLMHEKLVKNFKASK